LTRHARTPADDVDPIRPRGLLRWGVAAAAVLALVALVWVTVQALSAVLLLVYAVVAALLLAALLQPLVELLRHLQVPRWLAALLVELLLILGVFAVGVLVVRRAVGQLSGLRDALNSFLTDLQNLLTGSPLSLSQQVVSEARARLVDSFQQLVPSASAVATIAVELLSALVIVVFVLFFLLKDGSRMWAWALGWSPRRRRALVDDLGQVAWATLSSYSRGVVVVALADAVAIGTVLVVLDVPLAASLTLVIFLGAFIPIIGATVSGALAVAVTAVSEGTVQALVVLAAVLLVQQLEGNVLQPLVMERAVDLHPVVIVLSVSAGALLAGVGGAAVAVPLVAVGYRLADRVRHQIHGSPDAPPAPASDPGCG